MKIAIYDPLGYHGGFHYYTESLAAGVAAAGASVTLYTLRMDGRSEPRGFEIEEPFFDLYGATPTWQRALRFMSGLCKAMWSARKRGIQLVHIHTFHYDAREVLSALAIKMSGFKLAVTIHDVDSFGKQKGRSGRSVILKIADAIIVHNNFSREALIQSGEVSRVEAVSVIPHGHYIQMYPEMPSREASRDRLRLPVDRFVILFFGNPRSEKGLDLLLEALQIVKDDRVLLLVAGKIPAKQLSDLREVEKAFGGTLRIDAGHVSDAMAEHYYRASDAIVVPYRRIYESGVAIMAMSFSRALIYSDLPPLVESIADGGISFISGSAQGLAAAISAAIDQWAELDEVGEVGRRRVEELRDWAVIGASTLNAYERVSL